MTVAILIPVLRRPHRVAPLLESIRAVTPDPYRVLFICTPNDLEEHFAIDAAGGEWVDTPEVNERGDYPKKINLGYRSTTEPLMFLGADDLHFHEGWFEAATRKISSVNQVVGTNDLGNKRVIRGDHATHSLVTRKYVDEYGTIDEPGKVLHEGYWHEFCDDEFIATAKHRRTFISARHSLVEHLHPNWGKMPMDDLYAQEPKRMKVGRRIYQDRAHLWT